jgi:hypothetical protein
MQYAVPQNSMQFCGITWTSLRGIPQNSGEFFFETCRIFYRDENFWHKFFFLSQTLGQMQYVFVPQNSMQFCGITYISYAEFRKITLRTNL